MRVGEVTFFSSLYTAQGRRVRISWPALFSRFERAHVYGAKTDAPRWSATTFTGDRRSLATFEGSGAVAYDLDRECDVSTHVVAAELGHMYGFVHSTWSSTCDAPRSRLVRPTDRLMTSPDEHDRVWRFGAGQVERSFPGAIDYSARDAAHVWSVPAVADARAYRFAHLTGAVLEVERALAEIPPYVAAPLEAPSPAPSQDLGRRMHRASRWLACVDPAVSGSGGHRATFRAALGLVKGFALPEDIALELLATEYNPRCSPPWSIFDLRHKVRSAAQRARLGEGYMLGEPRRSP